MSNLANLYNKYNAFKNATFDTALAMGSAIVAEPVSGLGGLFALASGAGADKSANVVRGIQDAMTYRPTSAASQEMLGTVGEAMAPVAEGMEYVSRGAGDAIYDATGSEALAAGAYAAPTGMLELMGLKGARAAGVGRMGRQFELGDVGGQRFGQRGAVNIDGDSGVMKSEGVANIGGVRSASDLLDDLQNAADDLGLDYSEAFEVGGTIYYPESWINKLSDAGKGGLRHEIARQNEKVLGALESKRGGLHGTNQEISSIDASRFGESTQAESAKGGFWTVDRSKMGPRTAGSYADYAATDVQVRKLMDEAEKAEKAGDWDLYDKKLAEAEALDADIYNEPRRGQNIIPMQRLGKYKEIDMGGADFMDVQSEIHKAMEAAKKDGFDGVTFKNLADEVGFNSEAADHTVTFDPSKIRSEFAALDPQFKKSKNILASPSGVALGGAYLYNKMQQEQNKN